jgi:uncharacterized membrane protein
VYGALISSGPWILTVVCLFGLDMVARGLLEDPERHLFLGTVTTCFIFSLIATGPLQMSVARYVSDCLYAKNYAEILPSFLAACLLVVIALGGGGVLLWGFVDQSIVFRFFAVHLFVTIGMLWLVLIYLTLTKNYMPVIVAYSCGTTLSFLMGGMGAIQFGVDGILGGFTVGQMVTLVWLIKRLMSELPYSPELNWNVLSIFHRYPRLVLVGLFYNLAIWVDKMIFWWFAPGNLQLSYFVYVHPVYDSAAFLTFLTVIPTIALFVIRVEVTFFQSYRSYYVTILNNRSFKQIRDAHRELVQKVRLSIHRLLKMQGLISFLVVVFAPWIVDAMYMNSLNVTTVRFLALGAGFHILFYLVVIFLTYFDFQQLVLWLMIGFAAINVTGTLISLELGPRYYGIGYFAAGFLMFFLTWRLLLYQLDRLEFITFVEKSAAAETS